MTRSFVIDPETGKLLTAQEWKDKAEDNVKSAKMVAIVPDDGSPAFAFPVKIFDDRVWSAAMKLAKAYKAPHDIEGSDSTFTLPTRKQGFDFRIARECGLEQLLEMIGANTLLEQLRNNDNWTREKCVPVGTSEDRWSSIRDSAIEAWSFAGHGYSTDLNVRLSLKALPVTLLRLNP